jgi:hypothetical protein
LEPENITLAAIREELASAEALIGITKLRTC